MNTDDTVPIYTQQQLEEHIRIVYAAEAAERERLLDDRMAERIGRALAWLTVGVWIGWVLRAP